MSTWKDYRVIGEVELRIEVIRVKARSEEEAKAKAAKIEDELLGQLKIEGAEIQISSAMLWFDTEEV